MTVTQLPPSGWYTDPEQPGFERFWSGTEWSEQRRPTPAVPQPQPVALAPASATPLRNDADYFMVGSKPQGGRLLLYPDRLVHVHARMQHTSFFPLVLIMVVFRWIARVRAPQRVAAGDASIVTVLLATVSQVQLQKRGLGQALTVLTTTGETYVFSGVWCDKWLADLGTALSRTGRQVSPTNLGLYVA
jgi:hypothetical protein